MLKNVKKVFYCHWSTIRSLKFGCYIKKNGLIPYKQDMFQIKLEIFNIFVDGLNKRG